MKLKQDDNGNAVLSDGKPVYVKEDGSETAFDVVGTVQTISRLNAEAKTHRERAEAAESAVKAFEGIDDPSAAIKALETVKNLDDKKLVDAGQIEEVKAAAIKAADDKYAPVVQQNEQLQSQLRSEIIGGNFARSKFIAESLVIPADMVEATFGRNFSIEEGKLVAKDASGNQIFSSSNPGEPASFEEAIQSLVSNYPNKDAILKGANQSGSGSEGGQSGGNSSGNGDFGGDKSARTAAIKNKFPNLPER